MHLAGTVGFESVVEVLGWAVSFTERNRTRQFLDTHTRKFRTDIFLSWIVFLLLVDYSLSPTFETAVKLSGANVRAANLSGIS